MWSQEFLFTLLNSETTAAYILGPNPPTYVTATEVTRWRCSGVYGLCEGDSITTSSMESLQMAKISQAFALSGSKKYQKNRSERELNA